MRRGGGVGGGLAICLLITDHINQRHNSGDVLSEDLGLCEASCFRSDCRFWDQIVARTRGVSTKMPSNCEPGLRRECKLLLKAGDNCDIFLYRAVIESGLESSVLRWYCYHSMPAGCIGWGGGGVESEMWSRYNGVLHRSAQNYWPLSRFSMFPSHPPQHPALISSPSGRGFSRKSRAAARLRPLRPSSLCSSLQRRRPRLWRIGRKSQMAV